MLRLMCHTLEDKCRDRQRETCCELPGSIVRGNLRANDWEMRVLLRAVRRIRLLEYRLWPAVPQSRHAKACTPADTACTPADVRILMSDSQTTFPKERTISGRLLVVGMFVMGITLTSLLYAYSKLHLGPFRSLQDAIVNEFPGSAPRVDGGKKKPSKNTPTILRILVKTEVDPLSRTEESELQLRFMRKRIGELALEKVPLPDLAILEIHIYKLLKEDDIHKRSYRMDLKAGKDWIEIDQQGEPILTHDVDPGERGMSIP